MARPFIHSCVHTPNVYSALTLGPFVLHGEVLEVLEPWRKQIRLPWNGSLQLGGGRERPPTNKHVTKCQAVMGAQVN